MSSSELCPVTAPLVERARSGDPAAFTELVKRYEARVYQLALWLTGNKGDATDVIEDVFLSVYRKIRTFRPGTTFGHWLDRITARAAFDRLERRQASGHGARDGVTPARDGRSVLLAAGWELPDGPAHPAAETRAALGRAIHGLPEELRSVVILRDVQNLPDRDVAELLSLSIPAVRARLHQARLRLRHAVGESAGS